MNVQLAEPLEPEGVPEKAWAVRLFEKSPLKQKKLTQIRKFAGPTEGMTCLDVGSDNGVISLFLRKQGGTWYSCDLIEQTVVSIRELVGERVDQITGLETPYQPEQFDLVVIVDFLEHIETDREFVNELYRIMKPTGKLVINVPNPNRGPLRWFRHLIGQTDKAHGHVRPGYTPQALQELLDESFEIQRMESYSRFFSAFIDTALTLALDLLKRGGRSKKGTVVTGDDMQKMQKSFRLYSLIYPIVALFVKLDSLFFFLPGNMLICETTKTGTPVKRTVPKSRPKKSQAIE